MAQAPGESKASDWLYQKFTILIDLTVRIAFLLTYCLGSGPGDLTVNAVLHVPISLIICRVTGSREANPDRATERSCSPPVYLLILYVGIPHFQPPRILRDHKISVGGCIYTLLVSLAQESKARTTISAPTRPAARQHKRPKRLSV